MSQLSSLAHLIRYHRQAYYNSKTIISDTQFDALVDQLRAIDPSHPVLAEVGAPVPDDSPWQKVDHDRFMGSQAKVQTVDEFRQWTKDTSRHCGAIAMFLRDPINLLLVAEPKLDGIDLSLQYRDGVLVHAVTRGDGSQGEDILRNAIRMRDVPTHAGEGDFTVRGQMMISKSTFAKMKAEGLDYKNPRNACAGISRRLDGTGVDVIDFIAFDCLGGPCDEMISAMEKHRWLGEVGFNPIDRVLCKVPDDVPPVFDRYVKELRDASDYEMDGLILRMENVLAQESIGDSGGCPRGQVAWKFEAETGETEVVDIVWQASKGTDSGRLTPKAILKPVDVMGVTITNATLNNQEFLETLNVSIGAKVMLARANDVIPEVVRVLEPGTGNLNRPDACPTCQSALDKRNKDLVCPNSDCPDKQLALVIRWVEVNDMLGIGEKIVELLVTSGKVKTPADLYRVTVEDLIGLDRMGERSANKAYCTIRQHMSLPLPMFISALGILDVGKSITQLMIGAGYKNLIKLRSAKLEDIIQIKGMGETSARALVDGLVKRSDVIDDLLAIGFEVVEPRDKGNLTGKSFCFTGAVASTNPDTGKRYTRKELQDLVVREGGTVKDSVGAGLTYLVQADASSTSSKSQKAIQLGTAVLSDADFLAMVGIAAPVTV